MRVESAPVQMDYTRGQSSRVEENQRMLARELSASGSTEKEQRKEYTPEELSMVVEDVNKTMEALNYSLRFHVHRATRQIMVDVVNPETKEVIREIPPEQMLDLAAKLKEMVKYFSNIVGILVDEFV